MVRVAYQTSADVYAASLQESFNKFAATKLPVGMCCPACGSRTASKENNNTYCYNCGTLSISSVKRVEGKPGILEAVIKWM
jgi:tRNA(Ile2) C34 agmatinyltransferase TiaS